MSWYVGTREEELSDKNQVLEKSKFNRETGAAINTPPNCTAMLEWMGIDITQYGGTLLEEVRPEPAYIEHS